MAPCDPAGINIIQPKAMSKQRPSNLVIMTSRTGFPGNGMKQSRGTIQPQIIR